jgi:protein SOK2
MIDNHMINGTKLLNVAGMTRGRRDGILKSEKTRHVVKIGPMHLKGVWWVVSAFFTIVTD